MKTHLIRQQYLHVELEGSEADALALQQSLPALCRNWITPAIEQALDRCAPPDRYLSIERLEIDAGTFSIDSLESKLAESVARAVEKSVREQLLLACSSSASQVLDMSWEERVEDAFIHFLKTGTLPWSFRLPAGQTLEEVVLASWEQAAGGRVPSPEVAHVLASPTSSDRLVRQFSPRFLKTLLARYFAPSHEVVLEVVDGLAKSSLPPAVAGPLIRRTCEVALALLPKGKLLARRELLAAVLKRLPAPPLKGKVTRELERRWPETRELLRSTGLKSAVEVGGNSVIISGVSDTTHSFHPEAATGIYVDNAGVVLLHPFLPAFLEALAVATEDKLLQPERALCLLHYLITGETTAPEYRLALLKVLCNIQLNTPVEADVSLTAHEQEEGQVLLRAAICHWDALRNTSPDALRATFLLRPGKLTQRHDGDWLLQVEPQTCDILLDQLPWGISMIKLPWMEKMLWVEWRP